MSAVARGVDYARIKVIFSIVSMVNKNTGNSSELSGFPPTLETQTQRQCQRPGKARFPRGVMGHLIAIPSRESIYFAPRVIYISSRPRSCHSWQSFARPGQSKDC